MSSKGDNLRVVRRHAALAQEHLRRPLVGVAVEPAVEQLRKTSQNCFAN